MEAERALKRLLQTSCGREWGLDYSGAWEMERLERDKIYFRVRTDKLANALDGMGDKGERERERKKDEGSNPDFWLDQLHMFSLTCLEDIHVKISRAVI